jgi:single-stranded-DNA-specific exonuclease
LADELSRGGPWGQHFPEPAFDDVFSVRRHRIVGEKHLKLTLVKEGAEIEAIAFNIDVDAWIKDPPSQIQALFRLNVNEYRGARTLQLVIQSFWRL